MQYTRYTDVHTFYRDTYDVLMRHEAQNVIPLGNIAIGNKGEDKTGWRDPVHWFMATVEHAGEIILTAVMTPPHSLTLYATDNRINDDALECLMNEMEREAVPCPGIMTEKELAKRYAEIYCAKNDTNYRIITDMRIYELTQVQVPAGTVRPARESDMAFLPYWLEGMQSEFDHAPHPQNVNADPAPYLYRIAKKNLYILEDNGMPVSLAGTNRALQTVCAIGTVYTPPYFRRKGYATACVAAVSQIVLDKGFKKCVLYTDLANPISNSIYMKIGYTPICDSLMLKWEH